MPSTAAPWDASRPVSKAAFRHDDTTEPVTLVMDTKSYQVVSGAVQFWHCRRADESAAAFRVTVAAVHAQLDRESPHSCWHMPNGMPNCCAESEWVLPVNVHIRTHARIMQSSRKLSTSTYLEAAKIRHCDTLQNKTHIAMQG